MKTQIRNLLNIGRAALPRRRTTGRSSLPAFIAAALLLSTITYQPSTAFAQGSLTPPGAPGPTMLTLSQVEPAHADFVRAVRHPAARLVLSDN